MNSRIGVKIKSIKKAAALLLGALTAVSLGGCTQGDFTNIDGIMSPPKLTDEQNMIYEALEKAVGQEVQLKYPDSGENRSAFVLQNIDDEPGDEAIVFYESTGTVPQTSPNVHVMVLDKRDGEWVSAGEIVGDGTEVDKISFGQSSSFGEKFIAIGYSLVNQTEKILKVYEYQDGELTAGYSQGYSAMEVMDIDMDSDDELVVISSGAANAAAEPMARLVEYESGGFRVKSIAKMDVSVYEYTNIQQGMLYPRKTALYLDGLKGTNVYGTEILYFDKGELCNAVYSSTLNITGKTTRTGLRSMDINNDGIIEIPVSSPMLGYETFPEEERLLRTDWNDLIDGQLVKIMSSYVNGGDGYIFKFPEEWVDKVSVRKDNATGDVVFFRYSGSVTNDENVVLRIRTIKRSDLQQQGVPQGYQEVKDNGQMTYLASVSAEGNADLAIDIKDVESNLLIMT